MKRLSLIALLVFALPACTAGDNDAGSQDSADINDDNNKDVWLSFQPTQCGTNPWEKADLEVPDDIAVGGELGKIVAFLQSKKIRVSDIGLVDPAAPIFVCEACSCPRGDRLVVRTQGKGNVTKLKKLNFTPLADAIGIAPIQCGGNPWENPAGDEGGAAVIDDTGGDTAVSEVDQVEEWASTLDATIAELGFIHPVELTATCASCSCPRGDFLVIVPEDKKSAEALTGEGFSAL